MCSHQDIGWVPAST